jgi:hypothetical protein
MEFSVYRLIQSSAEIIDIHLGYDESYRMFACELSTLGMLLMLV